MVVENPILSTWSIIRETRLKVKETVLVPHYGAQANAQDAQTCSGSAQVKAAVAHVRRLKQNQRKGKLILCLWVFAETLRVVPYHEHGLMFSILYSEAII